MILRFASFLFILMALGCSEQSVTQQDDVLRPVRSLVMTGEDTVRERTFSGVIQSSLASRLSFKVGGTVVSIPVQVGSSLSAGDVLARLDASTFELELEQARAKLVQAQASHRNAQSNYDRVKGLYENSNASKNELDVARANAETSLAEVRSARKSVEIANLNKSYTTLNVASDCTVADLAVEENENVTSGQEIATVNCGDGLEVQFGVPEGLIGDFATGGEAVVTPNTANGNSYAGRIIEIGVGAASSAATYPVTVLIQNPDAQIRPNMAAQVTFAITNGNGSHFHVPTSAVAKDAEGTFVLLALPEPSSDRATVKRQSVQVGELTSQGLEILSGLSHNDRLITAGLSFLRDGQTVLVPKGS